MHNDPASGVRPSLVDRIRSSRFATQLLQVDAIRYVVARARFAYFKRKGRDVAVHRGGPAVSENAVTHNLKGISAFGSRRTAMLVRPLSVIETLGPGSRILSIGPRTEGELWNLVAHGFKKQNVLGLDLISTSPWIEVGDMHSLPYEDDSWDAVVLGWVLAYSEDRTLAAKEIVRVTRPGGIVAVGVEYNPLSNEEILQGSGYLPGSEARISSVDEILSYFHPHVDHVYFNHDVAPGRGDEVGSLCAIFRITK